MNLSIRELILIPEGRYLAKCHGWITGLFFGRQPKVVLECSIADLGEFFEIPIQRHYNAQRLIGKPGKNGRCVVGRSSDCLREFTLVAERRPQRLDRLPFSDFQKHLLDVEVATVAQGRDGRPVPEMAQYSVIRRILGIGQ